MRFCPSHWESLNESLKTAGVWAYVDENVERAKARLMAGGYEPRLAAIMAIIMEAGKVSNGAALEATCPVCFCVERCPCGKGDRCDYHGLTANAGEGMAIRAVDLGLPLHLTTRIWT